MSKIDDMRNELFEDIKKDIRICTRLETCCELYERIKELDEQSLDPVEIKYQALEMILQYTKENK